MAAPHAEGTVALTIGTTTLSATTVAGRKNAKTNLLIYVWQVSALAGLKLLGVSAGLLLARGASSRSRGTKTHGRRGRRSPKEVSHSHKQNPTLVFKRFFTLTGVL